jgi:DtxR family Mn-dependent transcriptional regulator
MVRRHRLIETFLVRTLGYGWEQVHDEAEHLEHAVSDFMIERIDALLDFPQRDPHGDPIPRADGTVDRPAAVPLPEAVAESESTTRSGGSAGPGESVRVCVERISDEDPGLLRHLATRGITVGTLLDVAAGDPYAGALSITVVDHSAAESGTAGAGGGTASLALDAARHLFVSRV